MRTTSSISQALKKLANLGQLPAEEISLIFELVVRLALSRLMVAFVSSKRITKRLGVPHSDEISQPSLPSEQYAKRLGQLLRKTADSVPWENKCLAQALVGKAILASKGIPCTVHLGVNKAGKKGFSAHAWLRCGSVFVTGKRGHGTFTELAPQTGASND